MLEALTDFHFLRPLWLLLILPGAMLSILLASNFKAQKQWDSLLDSHLLPWLLHGREFRKIHLLPWALFTLWLIASLAMAGPTWEKRQLPLLKSSSALVLVWDLSPSTLAEDIKPSRFERTRLKLIDVLRQRLDGTTALVVYSGQAHVVTPLTDDTRTIISITEGLNPNIMPQQGSNIEMALSSASELLSASKATEKKILILTDGISDQARTNLVDIKNSVLRNTELLIWSFGTKSGAPIPLAQGGFARDNNGGIIVDKVDSDALSRLAVELGAVYLPASANDKDLEQVTQWMEPETLGDTLSSELREFDSWEEKGPWLLLLLLPFVAMSFRRGWVLSLVFIFSITIQSEQATASSAFLTDDQRAQRAFQNEDFELAQRLFDNKHWKASAAYKAENYEKASKLFADIDTAEGNYNLGNSLAHQGKLQEAINAYDNALNKQPGFDQAKENKKILEELIKQQQEQQSQQQQGEKKNQDSENQSSEDQSSKDPQGSQQNSQSEQKGSKDEQESQQNNASNSQTGEQSGEDADPTNRNNKDLSQEELAERQQALKDFYQEDPKSAEELSEEPTQNTQAKTQNEKKEPLTTADEEQSAYFQIEKSDQSESDQEMQQWLRRIPDDPGGLLRNKFRYEANKRLRESPPERRKAPNQQDEQRW